MAVQKLPARLLQPPPDIEPLEKRGDEYIHRAEWIEWFQQIERRFPRYYSVAVDIGSVAANTSEEETATVTGLSTKDVLFTNWPTGLDDGLGIVNVFVKSSNTIGFKVMNTTASAINEASAIIKIIAIRGN